MAKPVFCTLVYRIIFDLKVFPENSHKLRILIKVRNNGLLSLKRSSSDHSRPSFIRELSCFQQNNIQSISKLGLDRRVHLLTPNLNPTQGQLRSLAALCIPPIQTRLRLFSPQKGEVMAEILLKKGPWGRSLFNMMEKSGRKVERGGPRRLPHRLGTRSPRRA